jgi:primosomal replication protein N
LQKVGQNMTALNQSLTSGVAVSIEGYCTFVSHKKTKYRIEQMPGMIVISHDQVMVISSVSRYSIVKRRIYVNDSY